MGAALQVHLQALGCGVEQRHQRRMRDRAVERAAPMKGVHAHGWPGAQPDIAAVAHVGRVGGEQQIELDRNVGLQRLRGRNRAAKVEFLLYGKHEVNGRALALFDQGPHNLDDDGAAGPVIDRCAGDAVNRKRHRLRPVDDGRADIDAGGKRFVAAAEACVDIEVGIGHNPVLFIRRRRMVALVGDDADPVPTFADAYQHGLRRQRSLGHAAEPLDADQARRPRSCGPRSRAGPYA